MLVVDIQVPGGISFMVVGGFYDHVSGHVGMGVGSGVELISEPVIEERTIQVQKYPDHPQKPEPSIRFLRKRSSS